LVNKIVLGVVDTFRTVGPLIPRYDLALACFGFGAGCSEQEVVADRYRAWIEKKGISKPDDWVFAEDEDRGKLIRDSGVRKVLKKAAHDAGCDFPGFLLRSFRRANITYGRRRAPAQSRPARSPFTNL
jgi:hypothetical protein